MDNQNLSKPEIREAEILNAPQPPKTEQEDKAPQKKPFNLFEAVNAPLKNLRPDELRFANEVNAALSRKPGIGAKLLSITVGCMFIFFIGWAAFASIDEVVHADGQVTGSQRTQTIQNLEGGILRGVLVHEGQIVEKGAALAQLDNEMAEASFRDAIAKAMENSLAIIRLEAELNDETPKFPEDLRRWLIGNLRMEIDAKSYSRGQQILTDQANAYKMRSEHLNAEINVLRSQLEQKIKDVEEQEARRAQLEEKLGFAVEQRSTASALMKRGNFSKMEYLTIQQNVADLEGQIAMLNASIPGAKASIQEFEQKIDSRIKEQKASISEEISKRRVELNSLRETLSAGGDKVTRTELRAPVRGTVKQIYINTIGGVVKPGESIMDLVPLDETLLVEAKVKPHDIAFLHPGQDVMVKVSAYDFSIYGGLPGKLESISADTIEDRRGDVFYLVKIRTPKSTIQHNNETLPIIPGMITTADIMIGKKNGSGLLAKTYTESQK